MEQTRIQQALSTLKEKGYKHTKKREVMLTYLVRRNRYMTAKEVHHYMNQIFPGVSYDTIYRNLHDFVDINLLEETDLNGEMKFRFHCCEDMAHHHHHHFICTVCGKTKELSLCPMDFFEEQLPGCVIEGHRFEILGRCEDCQ
ncbi:Fur family transcriptional regulator [Enterococcus asini]|uniref:Fur family transcriptional regulator n=1 Tax=Enterococcus TaxID=1350 RepID=UPI00288DF0E0|nr:Fur family transcriptional regulator [Enterococcus asini]MDT2756531.1 Fur family transcriptional regulator [Enterococcus asini]